MVYHAMAAYSGVLGCSLACGAVEFDNVSWRVLAGHTIPGSGIIRGEACLGTVQCYVCAMLWSGVAWYGML